MALWRWNILRTNGGRLCVHVLEIVLFAEHRPSPIRRPRNRRNAVDGNGAAQPPVVPPAEDMDGLGAAAARAPLEPAQAAPAAAPAANATPARGPCTCVQFYATYVGYPSIYG